jgi:hypothetical protein
MQRIRPFATIAFLAAALVACGGGTTTAAQIGVTNVWARPMVVEAGETPAMPTSGAAASAGMMGTTAAGSVMPGGMAEMGVGGVTDALYPPSRTCRSAARYGRCASRATERLGDLRHHSYLVR